MSTHTQLTESSRTDSLSPHVPTHGRLPSGREIGDRREEKEFFLASSKSNRLVSDARIGTPSRHTTRNVLDLDDPC